MAKSHAQFVNVLQADGGSDTGLQAFSAAKSCL